MSDLESIFAADGALAKAVRDFRVRHGQLEMAQAVADAIRGNTVLVAEAGTGTGKTFAYLVPALNSGGKVIISTGTKTLQDQLFDRDIPMVRTALGMPVSVALLKGRANYVCHHYLERAVQDGRLPTRADTHYLHQIQSFARTSHTGDKAHCATVPESAAVWSYVTSTRENCLGSECAHFDRCFVMQARKQALDADVVVVNHHLFFADLVLREEGVGELLPACNTVIFDEAHQLPETATLFFGASTSTTQLIDLSRDLRIEAATAAKDSRRLPEVAQTLERTARDLRLVFREDAGRHTAHALEHHPAFQAALNSVMAALDGLTDALHGEADRSEGLQRCRERGYGLAEAIEAWRSGATDEVVRWVEIFGHSVHLNATPLSIAPTFRGQIEGTARAWIFTSATLSVGGDFRHYCSAMGLEGGRTAAWESPYDYAAQGLLYVPTAMPEPNTPAYTAAVIERALPVIEAAGGRAFVLFTSLRAMREGHGLLKEAFAAGDLPFPLLLQGDEPRTELLERFRRLGNAVLVGSQSFWEGVDVRGAALSLVIIDKLPFAAPDDPVLAARIDKLKREGQNAFTEYQLPNAVITLKQGAGRLIRDETDRGVLMICDPRLYSKSYGRRILKSLPPMRVTRREDDAVEFFL